MYGVGIGTVSTRGVKIIISKIDVIPKMPRGFLLYLRILWQMECDKAAINNSKNKKKSGMRQN